MASFASSARFGKNLPRSNHVGKNKAKKRLENLGEIEPVPALFWTNWKQCPKPEQVMVECDTDFDRFFKKNQDRECVINLPKKV